MPENATSAPGDASNNELAALSDSDLDQKIGAKIQMIGSALEGRDRAIEGRDRAVEEVERCKKSAVLSAWRLGQFLIEKKSRLTHGGWLTWLDSCPRVSSSSAANYMRLARQISSAGNLGPSIRATLRALPAPATAKPKSKPTLAVRIVEPATAKPKTLAVRIVELATAKPKTIAVKIVEPAPVWPTERDSAAMIEGLENELYAEREKNEALEERVSIMQEAADPESRETANRMANQAELIRTLKASSADWQSKAGAARKEITMLKRKIKALEKEAA